MEITLQPLTEIKPYEQNPRINDAAVDAVAESIRQFGFRQPIVADAARLLSAAGGRPVTPEQIQADIEAGMPTNADGTINLVQYAAWLVMEMSNRGD